MEKEKIREQKLISLIEKQKESEFVDFKQEFYHKEATQDLIKDVISFAMVTIVLYILILLILKKGKNCIKIFLP